MTLIDLHRDKLEKTFEENFEIQVIQVLKLLKKKGEGR